ncbi:MAG: NUDIX hydrolase [Elusimicrobiota bacterium]
MKMKETFNRRIKTLKGKAVNFYIDEIKLPDGKKAIREYMDHPGAVAVLPFLDKERVILVKQYRYPVEKITYEIPAGKLDKGENPLSCVRRELEEETGYRPGRVKKICSFWPTPAFSDEVIHVYTADRLSKSKSCPDDDEFIAAKTVQLKQALKWIRSGRIKDSKTVIAILSHAAFAKKHGK